MAIRSARFANVSPHSVLPPVVRYEDGASWPVDGEQVPSSRKPVPEERPDFYGVGACELGHGRERLDKGLELEADEPLQPRDVLLSKRIENLAWHHGRRLLVDPR